MKGQLEKQLPSYFIKIFYKIGFNRRIVFIFFPQLFNLISCKTKIL